MNLTTKRRLIQGAAGAFLVAALGSVVWSLKAVDATTADNGMSTSVANQRVSNLSNSRASSTQPPTNASKNGLAADFGLPLQRPLVDPPKVVRKPASPQTPPVAVIKPPPKPAAKPRLNWTLVGTIIAADQSVAILTDADGKTDVRGVGEEVDLEPAGVRVQSIEGDQVTLDVQGNRQSIQLNRAFDSSSQGSSSGKRADRQRFGGQPARPIRPRENGRIRN